MIIVFNTIMIILLVMFVIAIIYHIAVNFLEYRNYEPIKKEDKAKYLYYRDLLKEYSIAELGYLYSGRKSVNLLITAVLQQLKSKSENNLNILEKYIVEHQKFIGTYQFNDECIKLIEESLLEKECIKPKKKKKSEIILIILTIVTFLWFFAFAVLVKNPTNYEGGLLIIYLMIFLFLGFISILVMGLGRNISSIAKSAGHIEITYGNYKDIYSRTSKGTEVYLKLLALKRYINDFGNFDDRELEEIKLWDEWILYAIILDESDNLTKDLKEEYENIMEVINDNN